VPVFAKVGGAYVFLDLDTINSEFKIIKSDVGFYIQKTDNSPRSYEPAFSWWYEYEFGDNRMACFSSISHTTFASEAEAQKIIDELMASVCLLHLENL
jgi:hypothetical protein